MHMLESDKAEGVKRVTLEDMNGKNMVEYLFKQANSTTTVKCNSFIKLDDDVNQINLHFPLETCPHSIKISNSCC